MHKDELIKSGMHLNVDFTWSYYAAHYDNDGFTAVTPKRVVFAFNEASTATFYQLKWA